MAQRRWRFGGAFEHCIDQVDHQALQRLGRDILHDFERPLLMFIHQATGLIERLGFAIQPFDSTNSFGCDEFAAGTGQLQQLRLFLGVQTCQCQCEQHGRSAPQGIATGLQFVVLVALPIVQVIENLKSHAQVARELSDRFDVSSGITGQAHASEQRSLKRGRGFQGIDLESIQRCQTSIDGVAP